jgi:hypothetical protein
MNRETFIRCNRSSSSCWPKFRPTSMTYLRLTSTGRGGNFDLRASDLERAARPSNVASFRRFGSPRAWASKASCGSGRSCCGSEIDRGFPRGIMGAQGQGAHSTASRLRKTRQPPQLRYASMLNINGGWWSQPSGNQSDSDQRRGWESLRICRVADLSKNPS